MYFSHLQRWKFKSSEKEWRRVTCSGEAGVTSSNLQAGICLLSRYMASLAVNAGAVYVFIITFIFTLEGNLISAAELTFF